MKYLIKNKRVKKFPSRKSKNSGSSKSSYQLTPTRQAMLAKRMGKYENGQTKFSTWEEVEKRIVLKAKEIS
jgi:hypothetical protein